MVAGGVPDRKSDHAVSVAEVAVQFLDQVRMIQLPEPEDETKERNPLKIRIGKLHPQHTQ